MTGDFSLLFFYAILLLFPLLSLLPLLLLLPPPHLPPSLYLSTSPPCRAPWENTRVNIISGQIITCDQPPAWFLQDPSRPLSPSTSPTSPPDHRRLLHTVPCTRKGNHIALLHILIPFLSHFILLPQLSPCLSPIPNTLYTPTLSMSVQHIQ